MEPTVFCLVVPLLLDVCSIPIDFDPFLHIRQERSISISTGNSSASSEGKIVNTAQTDKQLIINIETKVLPQFNVYLDSLQQTPRMQCTTNDETDGKLKKRVFTCVSLSSNCCPSTLTCICVPNGNGTKVDPRYSTSSPDSPFSSVSPLIPFSPNCLDLCAKCAPAPAPATALIPSSAKCRDLCAKCAAITRPTVYSTSSPQITVLPYTTALIPFSPNCKDLCAKCAPSPPPATALIPFSANCKDLCAKCASTSPTALTPASMLGCLENCDKKCIQQFSPESTSSCEDLCKQCAKPLIPSSSECKDLCQKCQPVEPSPTISNPKCISCNLLCNMCVNYQPQKRRQKRDVVNIENSYWKKHVEKELEEKNKKTFNNRLRNPITPRSPECRSFCENTKCPEKQCPELCFKCEKIGPTIDSPPAVLSEKCIECKKPRWNRDRSLVPRSSTLQVLCNNCEESPKCPQLCIKCNIYSPTVSPEAKLIPGSAQCSDFCGRCQTIQPTKFPSYQPGSPLCEKMCQKCGEIVIIPSTVQPSAETCEDLCIQCNIVPYDPNIPLDPGSNKCKTLCNQCKKKHPIKIKRKNCTTQFSYNDSDFQ